MFGKIEKWFEDHNITSHTIATAIITTATAYATNDQFFDTVNSILKPYPRVVALLVAAVGVYLKYSRARKALEDATPKSSAASAGKNGG